VRVWHKPITAIAWLIEARQLFSAERQMKRRPIKIDSSVMFSSRRMGEGDARMAISRVTECLS